MSKFDDVLHNYGNLNLSEKEKKWIEDCDFIIVDVQSFLQYKKLDAICRKKGKVELEGVEIRLDTDKEMFFSQTIDFDDNIVDSLFKKREKFWKLRHKVEALRVKSFGVKKNNSERPIDKFNQVKKAELIDLFGRMFTPAEVLQQIRENWSTTNSREVKLSDLKTFLAENIAVINERREEHKRDHTDLRLTAKKSRIEEHTHLYNTYKKLHDASNSPQYARIMRDELEAIRKETEGERIQLEGNLKVDIQQDINTHLREEVFKYLPLKEILIGRLAAKMGISSHKLIDILNKSHYAKFTSLISENTVDIGFEEVSFVSDKPYDFEKIRANNEKEKEQKLREEQLEQKAKIEDHYQDKQSKMKQLMRERLKKNKAKIKQAKKDNENLKGKRDAGR